jgi:monoamine oxidase
MLSAAGVQTTVLEARERIGGRVYTDTSFASFPIELGAELIHGERVVTHRYLAEAGLSSVPVDRYGSLRWGAGAAALPKAQHALEVQAQLAALSAAYAAIATRDWRDDRPLADYLRGCGVDEGAVAAADVLFAQTCCAAITTLGCADLAREMQIDHAGHEEFRVRGGYGPLLDWVARGSDIRLGTIVRRVSWNKGDVKVETSRGLFAAQRCILTLPVGVLQAGTVQFDPPLNAEKRDAIAALRLERATKLFLRFNRRHWDADLAYMAHEGLFARWWTPSLGVRSQEPGDSGMEASDVICCYVTAERAAVLDTMSDAEVIAAACAELETLLGERGLAAYVIGLRRKAWGDDGYARGGYAHCPPGTAAARLALAAPEQQMLFFAGEATAHDTNPQTVHGALASGERAAREVLE